MARLVVERPRAKVERLSFGKEKLEKAALEAGKSRAERLFDFAEESPEDRVSFGTKSARLMFPLYAPDHRFGQCVMPRGLECPDVGPGRYDNEEKSNLLHGLEKHVETRLGTVMGGRTADRFQKNNASYLDNPAPCNYVSPGRWESKSASKPFDSGVAASSRFPGVIPKGQRTPGAGSYQHDVETTRRPLYYHTFGGPRVLRVATEQLLPRVPAPSKQRKGPFVRQGFSYKPDLHERYGEGYLEAFYADRYEGSEKVLSILEGTEAPKFLRKKAYLSRYVDDAPPPGRSQRWQRAD